MQRRLETGAARMPDDWSGVFIRGDNAIHYAIVLDLVLSSDATIDAIDRSTLRGLRDLLTSCREPAQPQLIDWSLK